MIIEYSLSDRNFLKILEKHKDDHKELVSPTGCGFQDVVMQGEWVEPCTPEKLHELAMKFPDVRVRLSLISNHKKWYSRAKLKNLKLRIWVMDASGSDKSDNPC